MTAPKDERRVDGWLYPDRESEEVSVMTSGEYDEANYHLVRDVLPGAGIPIRIEHAESPTAQEVRELAMEEVRILIHKEMEDYAPESPEYEALSELRSQIYADSQDWRCAAIPLKEAAKRAAQDVIDEVQKKLVEVREIANGKIPNDHAAVGALMVVTVIEKTLSDLQQRVGK